MTMRLKDGIFLAPFHPLNEDPTLCIQRDLELIEHLDRLGYEEAWVGEHHSAGFEIIASPELFIAAAAERTKRIRLGTGVVSLPYHNPPEPFDPAIEPVRLLRHALAGEQSQDHLDPFHHAVALGGRIDAKLKGV